MATLVVPYHLDEHLSGFDEGIPTDEPMAVELPPGTTWERMAVLYEHVARAVSRQPTPVLVVSGDCTTSLGILAGLQRSGHDVGIV